MVGWCLTWWHQLQCLWGPGPVLQAAPAGVRAASGRLGLPPELPAGLPTWQRRHMAEQAYGRTGIWQNRHMGKHAPEWMLEVCCHQRPDSAGYAVFESGHCWQQSICREGMVLRHCSVPDAVPVQASDSAFVTVAGCRLCRLWTDFCKASTARGKQNSNTELSCTGPFSSWCLGF